MTADGAMAFLAWAFAIFCAGLGIWGLTVLTVMTVRDWTEEDDI